MNKTNFINETITLTFGDNAESHVGMNIFGKKNVNERGFNLNDLNLCKSFFENNNYECSLYNLNDLLIDDNTDSSLVDEATILVIKDGLNYFVKKNNSTINDFYNEMKSFEWDKKYYDVRRNKVLNKHARHNICFGELNILPNYENKIGRIISFQNLKI